MTISSVEITFCMIMVETPLVLEVKPASGFRLEENPLDAQPTRATAMFPLNDVADARPQDRRAQRREH